MSGPQNIAENHAPLPSLQILRIWKSMKINRTINHSQCVGWAWSLSHRFAETKSQDCRVGPDSASPCQRHPLWRTDHLLMGGLWGGLFGEARLLCYAHACIFIHVRLFASPWTVACQAPLSMGFSSKNTGMSCHFLLHGIFLSQGSNPDLLHCRQILYHLSHLGSPLCYGVMTGCFFFLERWHPRMSELRDLRELPHLTILTPS